MKKTIYVNLNFDDFHPQKDTLGDFGGDPASGTFKELVNLCTDFPGLVVTLFSTPNWIDMPYRYHRYLYYIREKLGLFPVVKHHITEPFLITKHINWCNEVKKQVELGNFEVAVHGLYHTNPNSRIHGQEFSNLDKDETKRRITLAGDILNQAGIPYTKAFRPPGWGVNNHLTSILKELGYEIYAAESSRSKTSSLQVIDGLIHVPQNWSIRESADEALRIAESTDVVCMKGHLVYQYGTETVENGLTKTHLDNIREALKRLNEEYDVRYVSFKELATIKI